MGSAAKIKNIITITHDKLKKKLIVNVKETKGTILDYDETFSKILFRIKSRDGH